MLTLLPSRMELTSPRSTALYQMLQSSPISTSPIMVAFSARKTLFPNFGINPLTSFMSAIVVFFAKVTVFLLKGFKQAVRDVNEWLFIHFSLCFLRSEERRVGKECRSWW